MKFSHDSQGVLFDGRREFLLSGEMHYFRVPRADWRRRMRLWKDAGGNFIPQRTHPFLEVHGGTLECWNNFRICDDPGADSTVFIDGGKFTVYSTARKTDPTSTTGTILVFGNCNTGDTSAPHTGVVTVCTNGILNITQFYIAGNSQKNISWITFWVLKGMKRITSRITFMIQ